jgi:hypothetical protein
MKVYVVNVLTGEAAVQPSVFTNRQAALEYAREYAREFDLVHDEGGEHDACWSDGEHDYVYLDAVEVNLKRSELRSRVNRRAMDAWLRDLLSKGPVPSLEVYRLAEEHGWSKTQLLGSRTRVGVVSKKGGLTEGWAMMLEDES